MSLDPFLEDYSLKHFVDLLEQKEPFSFARYGNGEWGCILRTAKRTGTGSQALDIRELRYGLESSIKRRGNKPNYYLGMQSVRYLERQEMWGDITNWLQKNARKSRWCNGEVWVKASIHGHLFQLLDQLRRMLVVVVGPPWLRALSHETFTYVKFIEVSPTDCFKDYRNIYNQVLDCPRGAVFSISAGPTTKVLIHDVFDQIGHHSWLVDFGSLWDVYAGRNTRRYHARIKGDLLRLNLRGK